jgi:hypothetical protein
MNKKILCTIFIAIAGFLAFSSSSHADEKKARPLPTLMVFHSVDCHNCIRAKKEILPGIEKEFKGKIAIDYRDIADIENYKILIGLEEKNKASISNVFPVFYFNGEFVEGSGDIAGNLRSLIKKRMNMDENGKPLPKADLVQRFNSFTIIALIAVGLIDGINPCAVTVIVFFISFLAVQGYKKQEIGVIGMIFITSVYVTYVSIGLGLFECLYRLQGFWLVTKIVNYTVGTISIIFSIYALYDFIHYMRTKTTDDMLLSLPKAIKNQIHNVIGKQYRLTGEAREPSSKRRMMGLAVSALITGFLVSVLEAVCVAKIYLPTIIFVLKTTNMKIKALAYLLLYNVLFIVPLLIIFFFALAGTTSGKFQAILKGNLGLIKILMSIMFLGLGIFLIVRA